MAAVYHINASGDTGVCGATKGRCPFGDASQHYFSAEAAQAAYEASAGAAVPAVATAKAGSLKTLQDFRTTPTEEDHTEAYEHIARSGLPELQGRVEWEKVMGASTPRTKNNVKRFQELQRHAIDTTPSASEAKETFAKVTAARKAYGRAYEAGVPESPALKEAFDKEFINPYNYGGGKAELTRRLAGSQQMLADLRSGATTPRKVVGTGYRNSRAVAEEHLTKELSSIQRDLATRGRSNLTNVLNVEKKFPGE